MGYSEILCHICGVSFNISRSRTDKEPRSAAWGSSLAMKPENSHGPWGCYYVKRDGFREPETASMEPVKCIIPKMDPENSSDYGWMSYTPHDEWEHIAGPGCEHKRAYNGYHISAEAMRGCQTSQCLVLKGKNWQTEQGDQDFEASGKFFLSGLSDDMPCRDMGWPSVSPARHGKDTIRAENVIWVAEDADEYCMPFHPACFEIFKRASLYRYGNVDVECLMQWWRLEPEFGDLFMFPRHLAVKQAAEHWWSHNRGGEFLVANPCFVPGLDDLLHSARMEHTLGNESSLSGTTISTKPAPSDPFSKLPSEMIREILNHLSFKDLANLRLTSRGFLHLPNAVLYEVTVRDNPWLYEAWSSLPISFWATTTQTEIKQKIERGGDIHATPRPVKLPGKGETDWLRVQVELSKNWKTLLGLQNRRRIWDDCQVILNRVDKYRKQGKI
ncbi:hypothetical protein F52700_4098 [Fusarium sp. NRRL 52700]|nr:hypothetical protein F52700_4098 [Fusarium sp. NRRL 52700]